MPRYTYHCEACRVRFTVQMSYSEYGQREISCPRCGSKRVRRVPSRIRVLRSEGEYLEALADPGRLAAIDEDPRALGKMMREMSSALGEDPGPEFKEVVDRLEKGQSPEEIEASLPSGEE